MHSEVKAAMAVLKAAFPEAEISLPTVRVYCNALEEFAARDAEGLRRAVQRLLRTARFFPRIADIAREFASEAVAGLPEPEEAWGEVVSELRRIGHTSVPLFSCAEIGQAMRAIGTWDSLCRAASNPSDRARFIDAYRVIRERRALRVQHGGHALPEPTAEGRALLDRFIPRLVDKSRSKQ